MSHFLDIVSRDGNLGLELRCDSPSNAPCRRQPIRKDLENWDADEPMDEGGHECWAVDWVNELGFDDAVIADGIFASVPIILSYYEGVEITPLKETE